MSGRRRVGLLTVVAVLLGAVAVPMAETALAASPCDVPVVNPVACENTKPGNPPSEWDTSAGGDPSIVGFTTDISVNKGQTVNFKVSTTATSHTMDIYRMGYYGGNGARKMATVSTNSTLARTQPACLTEPSTGLVDCGNWSTTSTWSVPSTAVSGIYFAHIQAPSGLDNHIVFVVRDDASTSKMFFQTSDTTWQAYNQYGGNSLYVGAPAGRAYKVSYNRPFTSRADTPDGRDFVFASEYPMVRFLEANGYDLSYTTGVDSDRRGDLIKNHQVFLSVGHDEYWSGQQRANVEAARDAGVHLAFFSGNEVYWKTRWETAIDGSGTPYRTLVSYKETRDNAKIDPSPEWTGTWRDPRFSPPSDGGKPENALTGTIFQVNCCSYAIKVPSKYKNMRLWRNTSIATMADGATATLAPNTLGYEWDEDLDNGFRPAGLAHMSETIETPEAYLLDYGSTVGPHEATHHLTQYRAASGALVFGAGTVQWSWGLDENHDGATSPPDVRMQQATVNLFADMGVQPYALIAGLTPASPSTDTTAPLTSITSPAAGASLSNGNSVTITGTATDVGGRVAAVEVSVDGGTTWHPAVGRESWSYSWPVSTMGPLQIKARAADDSGNLQATPTAVGVTVNCPCQLFANATVPGTATSNDANPVEVGVRFTPSISGWITGIRFYKGAGNTGTHVGNLWTSTGTNLGTTTFSGESASGWQQAALPIPVAVHAGQTYLASYYAPNGGYSADAGWFTQKATVSPPLTAPQSTPTAPNGMFKYGDGGGFPDASFGAANYWVDVTFSTIAPPDLTPPSVITQFPASGASSISTTASVVAGFNEPVQPATVNLQVRDGANNLVPGNVAYDANAWTATFTPTAAFAASTNYSVTVTGAADLAGNVMSGTSSWSFRTAGAPPPPGVCPCTIWSETAVPAIVNVQDPAAIELGLKFMPDADGFITGIRFYKGTQNTGTHTGSLWSLAGTRLATATFVSESTSGWQQVLFSTPVPVSAGTVYVASYHTDAGYYSATLDQLAGGPVDNSPLHALADGTAGPNAVYSYGASAFPTQGGGTNYWVDVVFTLPPDSVAPTVVGVTPTSGATNVPTNRKPTAKLSEPVLASSVSFVLKDAAGTTVPGTVTYDAASRTAELAPSAPLAAGALYTATVSGAQDEAGNTMAGSTSWTFTTSGLAACPCTIWSSDSTPGNPSVSDPKAVELGVKFRATSDGYITGVRFYKGTGNDGIHAGHLWAADGAMLASATFTNETASGWQTVTFPNAVPIAAGTTYVASYHAPNGGYAADVGYFANGDVVNTVLVGLDSAASGGNGVFAYGPSGTVPDSTYQSSNYWVDPLFTTTPPPDVTPPTVTSQSPVPGATSVPTTAVATAGFNEHVVASTIVATISGPAGAVASTTTYDISTRTATITPTAALAASTVYTVSVSGATDTSGNTMAAPSVWSFTTASVAAPPGVCPCSIWTETATPGVANANDTQAVELGVRFRSDLSGFIRGVRFYKGNLNTGTHVGNLWALDGTLLASATFTNETASGWQQVMFDRPIAVTAGTTYIASYHSNVGRYSYTNKGLATGVDRGPLHAPASTATENNGVYRYGATSLFPSTGRDTNYWVDVVFDTVGDSAPPTLLSATPAPGSTGIALTSKVTATFNEAVNPATLVFNLRNAANTIVTSTVTYDAATRTATLTPSSNLTQGVTYKAEVRGTDLSGNVMPALATWTFTTLVDVTAPVVSGVSATGSGTTATVVWTTNEASSSTVLYGLTPSTLNLSASTPGSVTSHSTPLTGLTLNTRYYYRVRSLDAAGNVVTFPAAAVSPLVYIPTSTPIVESTLTDFGAGTLGAGAYLTATTNGELALAPAAGSSEFSGTALPSDWTATNWAIDGVTTVTGGALTLDGARAGTTATFTGGRTIEFTATFSGARNQHIGFGTDFNAQPWAMFSTKNGNAMYARTRGDTGGGTETQITGNWLNAPHVFRIAWTPTQVVYSIDGVVRATHAVAITTAMRPLASDYVSAGGTVKVDWMRMLPYSTSGVFTSRVIDAVGSVAWSALSWNADVPTGTTMTLQVRTGNTATPDGTWSAFRTLANGASVAATSRYLQYRVTFSSTNNQVTPAVRDLTANYAV